MIPNFRNYKINICLFLTTATLQLAVLIHKNVKRKQKKGKPDTFLILPNGRYVGMMEWAVFHFMKKTLKLIKAARYHA
jgi:hypothetical protein